MLPKISLFPQRCGSVTLYTRRKSFFTVDHLFMSKLSDALRSARQWVNFATSVSQLYATQKTIDDIVNLNNPWDYKGSFLSTFNSVFNIEGVYEGGPGSVLSLGQGQGNGYKIDGTEYAGLFQKFNRTCLKIGTGFMGQVEFVESAYSKSYVLFKTEETTEENEFMRATAYGYVNPKNFDTEKNPITYGRIHLNLADLSKNVDVEFIARVIIHEASHKFANTVDLAYEDTQQFSMLNPGSAINNADHIAVMIRDCSTK